MSAPCERGHSQANCSHSRRSQGPQTISCQTERSERSDEERSGRRGLTSKTVHCSRAFGERLKYKEGVERKAIRPPNDSSSSVEGEFSRRVRIVDSLTNNLSNCVWGIPILCVRERMKGWGGS